MSSPSVTADAAGAWRLGDLTVRRLGFGAMRLTGDPSGERTPGDRRRQADAMGESADALLQEAQTVALQALREPEVTERLAKDLALKVVRRRLLEELPTNVDTTATLITVSVSSSYPGIHTDLDALLAADDLDGAVRLAPIRTTKLRDRVARVLHFRSYSDYETTARVRISKGATLAAEVRALIGPLPS